jgi:hypothetical protein
MRNQHEEILRYSREKNDWHFLENPEWGVGATRSRGYISKFLIPKWCVLCGTGDYLCLGPSCMGLKRPVLLTGRQDFTLSRSSGIPGKFFKKTSTGVAARLPGLKKSTSARGTQEKKFKNSGSRVVARKIKIPQFFPPFCANKRRVKQKVKFY